MIRKDGGLAVKIPPGANAIAARRKHQFNITVRYLPDNLKWPVSH
jgi:hypothetical protein